ncbi:hypothetical protein Afil01_40520 [Actinorhabdospora filicis]|uniref:RNA polymerase sigma-70 region 2 domain-containing protein n=1 Tax=Actinorhabdospora filicis TaxID=1785913 RepID=A0A9W6SNR6_9ACTN|nr:sigma factor [Actinorhabdospora filicis]GLZ79245.1 hypothetical protein Afil01_40520 [Actinorhabdospora filicis]
MIAAPVGSPLEASLLNELVRDHRYLVTRAARGFARWCQDLEDLEQEAFIALPRILSCYVPARGKLSWYALKSCRRRMIGYLAETYYAGVRPESLPGYRLVHRRMRVHLERFGRRMTETEVVTSTGLPSTLVREAMCHHARRVESLDDPGRRIRSRHETVGTASADMERAELLADLRKELRDLPDAAALVIAVAIDGEAVEAAGRRLGMAAGTALDRYQRALHRLEGWAASLMARQANGST